MNIGDTFVDPQKRTWTIEEFLGQGTWGRSYRARHSDGQQCVLKVALQASDFPADTPLPDHLVRACRDTAREQIALLERGTHPFLPRLIGSFTLSSGTPALMLAHYQSNLERRIATGTGLTDTISLLARLATQLGAARFVHGNLRPSNILVNERGDPVVADPFTPALGPVLERLEQIRGAARFRPPEAAQSPTPMWDTWALCQALYQAALHREMTSAARPAAGGLDKVEIATLKDRALARLKLEHTNPRFRSRMSDKLGALLHRGLSLDVEPSPPFRFVDCVALGERLAEVASMVDPSIDDVGRLLPPAEFVSGVFRGDQPVEFSVSVGCSPGVTSHEDVVCGLRLIDLDDADARIPIPEASYKAERHRSGRLRFGFSLPDLAPGRYRLKIAFSVRDSGAEPHVAGGEFEVRPPPGYIPPVPEHHSTGGAIMLDRVRPAPEPAPEPERPRSQIRVHPPLDTDVSVTGEVTLLSDPGTEAGSDPGAEIIEGLFPRPIAPPTDQPREPMRAQAMFVPSTPTSGAPSSKPNPMYQPAPTAPPQPHEAPVQAVASMGGPSWSPGSPPSASTSASSPGIGLAMPSISIGAATGPALPRAAEPAPPVPAPTPDSRWFTGQMDDYGLEGDGLLPDFHDDGEELPDWNRDRLGDKLRSIPGFDQFLEWMQRDSYTAFVAAAAGSFVLLLMMMALLKAF